MNTTTKIICILCCTILLTCDEKTPISTQNLQIVTYSNEKDIEASQTWKSNEIHIVKQLISINDAVLTIEPGAVIKFEKDCGIRVNHNSGLFADGSNNVIQFTSDNQNKGDWKYIYFGENALADSCKLINCTIEFGGGDSNYPGALVCENTQPEIRACSISQSLQSGVVIKGNCRGIEFFNNSISSCGATPIQTSAINLPYIGLNRYNNNQKNFIDIIDDLTNYNDTWYKQPLPLRLTKGLFIKNSTLKIFSEVELYFPRDQGLCISDEGCLKADGSLASIKFAGIDSSYWNGIVFESSANSTESSLINCIISDGGNDETFPACIVLKNAAAEISNCLIENSSGYGVYIEGAFAPASFVNNQFSNNALGAISVSANAASGLNSQNFGVDETNFISVRGGLNEGDIVVDGVWKNLNVPYKVENSIQIISSVLTIDPGVQIFMSESSGIKILYQAGLIADGSSGKITIEGALSYAGFWNNIYFAQDAKTENCRLINCQIKYGGGDMNQPGMVYCDFCSPVIRNCYIEHSGSWGIYVNGNVTISDIETNIFYGNVNGDYYFSP